MDWTKFNTYGESDNHAFEVMCNMIFNKEIHSEYGENVNHFAYVNGSGGDGGVEAYCELKDGSVIAIQSKWFPNSFDSNSEYFLGSIVTFKNDDDKMEVIDGQQRLTTLMLLLRAFYSKFGHMQDKASVSTRQNIEKCLWKTDEFGEPDMTQLKMDSGVNALRTPVYAEMVNIVNNKPVEFAKYKFSADTIRSMFDNFSFNNGRPITKAMITWWAFQNDTQPLLSLETVFEIEHIYSKNRHEKEGTGIVELLNLTSSSTDFTEKNILERYDAMMSIFIEYLKLNDLLQ